VEKEMNVRDILKEHQKLKTLAENAMNHIGDSNRNISKDSKDIEAYYLFLNRKLDYTK